MLVVGALSLALFASDFASESPANLGGHKLRIFGLILSAIAGVFGLVYGLWLLRRGPADSEASSRDNSP